MKYFFVAAYVLIFFSACSGTDERQMDFEKIYNLMSAYNLDSAQKEMNRIDTNSLSPYEYSLFNFQDIIIKYKRYEPSPDTMSLNNCINLFEEYGDERNLCRGLAYKAGMLVEMDKFDKAIFYLKEAEKLVGRTGDKETEMRIYSLISHINIVSANMTSAMNYADRMIGIAYETGNKRWLARGLDEKGIVYGHLGCMDSSAYYEKAAIPYLAYLPKQERTQVLNNIALAYSYEHKYDSAEIFFHKSLKTFPMPHVYGNLAVLKMDNNIEDSVEEMFRESFKTKDLGVRIYLMTKFSEWLQKHKRFEEATAYGLDIKKLYDSLAVTRGTERVKGIQEKYDKQVMREQSSNREVRWLIVVTLTLLLMLAVYLYYRKTVLKGCTTIAQMNEKVVELEQTLDKLRQERRDDEREAKELRKRAEKLKKEMGDILSRGKQRFEGLTEHDETVVRWHKNDFVDAIEYYSMQKPLAMKYIEDTYKGLSATQILYLQLRDYGLDDQKIKHIFGLSDGAMRTMKSRINKKMRVQKPPH